jgi:type IV secretory pathway VirB4 component
MMTYLNAKNILIAIVLFFTVLICIVIYRMFFQFNSKDISIYIDEEASKYEDKAKVFGVIQDGVEHILSSHNLTQQVLKTAKYNKVAPEQLLVHAAIMQCKTNGFLETDEPTLTA